MICTLLRRMVAAVFLCILAASSAVIAQSSTPPKAEVRAVWITTVSSLDWPRSTDRQEQQRSLRVMIDKLARANFNTIYFQVRGRGDAMYRSSYEPWSVVLTGTLGKDPGWDPLEFAVKEAHERGMELHAWFNVFLVKNAGAAGRQSIVARHPEWVREINGEWWLDPGIPAARAYTVSVAMDIARGYDIDGLHFDFMRYPERGMDDDETYRKFGNRKISKADWRRSNINAFLEAVYDSAASLKPRLKVGAAPIGIYHNTNGIIGLQSFDNLYQDSREWLRAGYADYIVPQVYWPMGREKGRPDFAVVANDWSVNTFGRHIVLGVGVYKPEVARQVPQLIDTTRWFGFAGNAYFRYEHIEPGLSVGMRYRYPALIPAMSWKDSIPPSPPVAMQVTNAGGNTFRIAWKAPRPSRDGDPVHRYNIYRSATHPVDVADIRNLVESVYADRLSYQDVIEHPTAAKYYYTVTAMDAGNNESGPSVEEAIVIPEIVTLAKRFAPEFRLSNPIPNTVEDYVYFTYEIPEPQNVVLGIYDQSNTELFRVVDAFKGPGKYVAAVNVEKLRQGEYRYRLTAGRGSVKGAFYVER